MWIQRLQKIISGFLIFFLLFSVTFQVPILQYFSTQSFAEDRDFYNLVSIIVDEDTYDATKSKLVRYSRDIQGVLENTRVVILPTPSDASALDIASLNESLFFEGYKSVKDGVDFESRLVGTVLVGKIPVPIVFDDAQSGRSILPYVDFEEKTYTFDHSSGKYQKSALAEVALIPEIWHGVISPNTGNQDDDIASIKDYFDKNHEFYTGKGVFEQEKGVIDGIDSSALSDYEPYVFYYDQFRENNALKYEKYVGYQMYLNNIEDITYNRYSKALAEKVKNQVLGIQNLEIQDLLAKVDPDFDISGLSSGPDVNASSDILSRYITDNASNKFLEIFNNSTLGEMRSHIYNAGRYNKSGSKVNVDMPPFLISILDQVSAEVLKNVNTSLEKEITGIVTNGLSRDIAIPQAIIREGGDPICGGASRTFYYGAIANNISNAASCSIYRGNTNSGTLVEANRGYNINLSQADQDLCKNDYARGDTSSENVSQGYWGGNTPLNFNLPENGVFKDFELKNNNLKTGIVPIFDILGSKETKDITKNPSPLDCFTQGVNIQTYQERLVGGGGGGEDTATCVLDFQAPVLGKNRAGSWSCRTINTPQASGSFEATYKSRHHLASTGGFGGFGSGGGSCVNQKYSLEGPNPISWVIDTQYNSGGDDGDSCSAPLEEFQFKAISSHILHTSPTDAEFGAQTRSMFTPSLPIDSDRYIDFIGAKGGTAPAYGYERIDFPQLFRVQLDDTLDLTFENIEVQVKKHLDTVSAQINNVITRANPSSISDEKDKKIYQLLKTGDYPSANIDLYKLLQNKPLEVFTLQGQSKEISYYDTLVFAVYWNNLNSVSSKYKFVFEEYLSNQFEGNEYKFHLPKSRKSYETSYLAAPGDAQNMYIKLDPEQKAVHPYANILSANLALQTTLLGGNIADPENSGDTFKCSPPDGVPIWEWIPAVICWLKDMLPPKITIGQGSCGYDTLFLDEDEKVELLACEGDANKNGVNDCIEGKLDGGSLNLRSDSGRYFYNTPGTLSTQILDASDSLVSFDNISYIENILSRVEIPANPTESFIGANKKVIYDVSVPSLSTKEARGEAEKYISFTDSKQRALRGESKAYFYGKGYDANIYFEAKLKAIDSDGNVAIDLKSDIEKIEIRGDQVFINSYVIDASGDRSPDNTIKVSSESNIFLFDLSRQNIDIASNQVVQGSSAKEKILLGIGNYSKGGVVLPLNYPLSLQILLEDRVVFEETEVSEAQISSAFPLFTARESGRYEVVMRDGNAFETRRSLDILPEKASSVNAIMSSSLVETDGNLSTHLATIQDMYGNPATGEIYTIELSIQGAGLTFDTNGEKNISYQIIEGYKAFRLKSTSSAGNNTLNIILKDISGNIISETSAQVQTVKNINLKIQAIGKAPQVGNKKYTYNLAFTDSDGNVLTSLNSRVYFSIGKLYGKVTQAYTDVVGGIAEVSFTTSTLAGENIPLEIQLEGGNEIYKAYTDILPEAPIKIDLNLSKDKMEASREDISVLQVLLKDRYNNIVFNDNTTVIDAAVHERSTGIISIGNPSKKVARGRVQFQIQGTDIPGTAYFKVSSKPDLGNNSFNLIGQAPFDTSKLLIPSFVSAKGTLTPRGIQFFREFSSSKFMSNFSTKTSLIQSEAYKELPGVLQFEVANFWDTTNSLAVSGIGENAGSIETFYFWSEEDISGNAYNGLYSVLAGAPYGDISQENYLAGALLFDRDNSSLAVSSLLSSPYKYKDVFSLEKNGFLSSLQSSDISQDIEFLVDLDREGRLIVDIQNAAMASYIGRIYYNITKKTNVELTLNEALGNTSTTTRQKTSIKNTSGKTIFEIYPNGRFVRKSGSYISFDTSYVGSGSRFIIKNGEENVGTFLISGDLDINITRDSGLLDTKLSTLSDTLIVHLSSNQYSSREIYGDKNTSSINFYYNDPFAVAYQLDDFHDTDIVGLETFYDEAGIGWKESNTMLLSFSAGESVGEASKNFQSFSLINLGDPVVSLKALEYRFAKSTQKKSFDPTVGQLIEKDARLKGYQVFDYNSDDALDILTIHQNGYMKLFENIAVEEGYVEHGNLAFASDIGGVRFVKTGDFTGDGYDDIFFVTKKGKPALFNNVEKDFQRYDLDSQFSLSGSIIQAESFDMDADGNDDIVTLDVAGEIHIFYGGGTNQNPQFTKKYIGDGYAVSLSEETFSHGGAIYFDGLTQISKEKASALLRDSKEYLTALSGSISEGKDTPNPEFIDESLVNSFLYMTLPYIPTSYETTTLTPQQTLVDSLDVNLSDVGGSVESESLANIPGELDDFLTTYDEYITYSGYQNTYNSETYFLRSPYASTQNIEIKKKFEDTSPPFLQTGDSVYFDISIKNTGSTRINNVAYADQIPEYFGFKNNEITILTEDNKVRTRKPGIAEYDIIFDGFYLDPGEETIFRVELETLPLQYGYMQVGLYEAGEVGDDIYGDIILRDSEKNCGLEADIYRSIAVRSYERGVTAPSCEADAIDIGTTFPELKDDDNDGVPDYLQNILENQDKTEILSEYSNQALEELGFDSDGDGIPDKDDTMKNTDSSTDFMGALDKINEAIDEISEDIDELIQGLSCGFGGGSCFANPLNWAPLAPGSVPTLMGMPLGPLTPNSGVPVFSSLTGRQTSCGKSPCCLPSVFPRTSQAFVPGPFCGPPSAGGSLGTWSPTNFVRLFATPTLTGGFGIAACFGGPAIVAGNANPMGIHPIVPGGNCIVAAMPLFGCDGGEGDPGALGYPHIGKDFDIIAGNCDGELGNLSTPQQLEASFIQDYLEYLRTGKKPVGMYQKYQDAMKDVSEQGAGNFSLPTEPLINIGSGESGLMSSTVDLDLSALASGNFQDVVKVKNKRIGGFPNFMMDWVERQLDEVVTKLTNLPKIFVILPDFGGIFDFSWKNFGPDMKKSFEEGKNKDDQSKTQTAGELSALRSQKSSLNCGGSDKQMCRTIDLKIASTQGKSYAGGAKETLSGIKEAYEFLGNIPLVNIETETINVSIPWIDMSELNRFSVDWKYSLEQYKGELASAKSAWSIGVACNEPTEAEQARCEQENDIRNNAYIEAEEFIHSLETNIQILKEYKEFPDRLAKLINIKEVWLEQILCNIEAIASLLGEWIGTNGKRFKAWVELYVLIKAILKSWQLFIDVFTGYEEECHQCKNERQDLQNFIFRLISAIIPSPPIIEFPKWPDIVLDLHNIRAGMNIYLPDFQLSLRPIVLPTLPKLNLPAVPSVGFSLPALPILPRFTLPELPELPSLPTIELPDLPPPPKIPKLFGAAEAVLNIMKLVTKVMCILKSSPFVPEWRAGDQIAFLTERNGYLPLDFIDIQPPAFSYSAISAIKVTAYVNMEFEMEFIMEAVRAITEPLDKITSNIVNMFDIQLSNIDLSEAVPEDIRFNIDADGEINPEVSLKPLDTNPEGIYIIAGLLTNKFISFLTFLEGNNELTYTNTEFKQYVGSQLASQGIMEDSRTKELREVWGQVNSLTYSKEDIFIEKLKKNNTEKFDALIDIISNEIQYSKEQQETLKNREIPSYITEILAENDSVDRSQLYNTQLEVYNTRTLDAAIQLVSGESEENKSYTQELSRQGKDLMTKVRGGLEAYKTSSLLAAVSPETAKDPIGGSCAPSGTYEYRYEGIYVLEYGKNYRLFEYTDMLKGDEKPTIKDMDNDGDEDVLYLAEGKLYLKENRKNNPTKNYISTPPLVLASSDNKFYNGETYFEAINYFAEANVSDRAINVEFEKPTNLSLKNFRMIYHTIVDRYLDETEDFIPEQYDTHIVDAVAEIDSMPITIRGEGYYIRKNTAVLDSAGLINGAKLTTTKFQDISEQIAENKRVTLTSQSVLYAGNNSFQISYISSAGKEENIAVPKYQNLRFNSPVTIIGISGKAYVSLGMYQDLYGADILQHLGMPLLPDTKISFSGNTNLLDSSSHIDIRYYDDSYNYMDMRDITSYTFYDLGNTTGTDHRIRLEVENDFYYARIQAFKNNIFGTISQQILLSPQTASDTQPPQIGLTQKIRIPVYQTQLVDLTPYIYEDGGLSGIADVGVDFDLDTDSDGDGNTKNDSDTENIIITKTATRISIRFGPYESLFEKQIRISLKDDNGNIGFKDVGFEVYPPGPSIDSIEENMISGQIDETLLGEPVRLYRYRGGELQKLQKTDGSDLVETDIEGNYNFEATQSASGLLLTYSGATLANIDEYSGKIDVLNPLASTAVLASNNPDNTSMYPEILIRYAGNILFRQFLKIPEGDIQFVNKLANLGEKGVYTSILNQERFESYRVPLGVAYNPGSLSVYLSSDSDKKPVMTVFRDGRVNINEVLYRLEYRALGEDVSLVLVQKGTNIDIAQVVFKIEGSYVIR